MPGYVSKGLKRFEHDMTKRRQDQPHPHNKPNYGALVQYATATDESPTINSKKKKFIQQVLGTFMYYARDIDCTMLVTLIAIAADQARTLEATMAKARQFLDYAASQEDTVVTYKDSNMVLAVHSDTSYLSEPKARSRAGGNFSMSNYDTFPANNGAVLSLAQIIKSVMTSAAETEIRAMFINACEAVPQYKFCIMQEILTAQC